MLLIENAQVREPAAHDPPEAHRAAAHTVRPQCTRAQAAAVCEGVLAIGGYCAVQPLVRIEAWRLLARCRGARGDTKGACEALESAVRESEAVGYVWMQAEALRDMLEWVEADDNVLHRLQQRLASVTSQFCVVE